jgi:nucleotide-binding universal stress UspA family protein
MYRVICGKPVPDIRCRPDAAGERAAQSGDDGKESTMFKTILWATDGSATAARALPFALGLAEPEHAKLVVAHAREIMAARGGSYPVFADESELRERIAEQVKDLKSGGFDATFVVRTCSAGHTAKTIMEIAEEVGADLIVVGTHGYGRVAGLLIGSVTQALLHAGVCPVLAIPTGAGAEAPEHELQAGAAT